MIMTERLAYSVDGRASRRLLAQSPLFLQAALVLAVLTVSVVVPPTRGAMLIVPIRSHGLASTVNWATDRGLTILASGPLSGSLMIFGNREALAWPAIKDGYLIIGAPASWCGARGVGVKNDG